MLKQKSKESNMNITNFSNTYRVSLLTSADVEIIYNLCIKNPIYYKYCPPTVTVNSIQSDMAALPPNKTMEDKYYVGYFDEEGILVAVMDFIDKYPDERTAFIGFFMVNADFQGRGIGSFLISELFQYLKSLEYERIRLGYVEGNEQSRNFWLKNGFQDTGLRNQADTYTVVVMNKDIIMRKKNAS